MPLYPKKNLVNNSADLWKSGAYQSSDGTFVNITKRITPLDSFKVKPNTLYTLRAEEGYSFIYDQYNESGTFVKGVSWGSNVVQFTTVSNANLIRISLRKNDDSNIETSEASIAKVMLAEGVDSTYEPYELGMKKRQRIEKINEDMTGSASHAYPFGNVISVKEDVRLWNANLKVYTTGTFNISVYEWNGGRVGVPLFDKKMNITSLTDFTYSFDGLELKAGKKYWIGRLSTDPESTDSVGNAAVGRSTGMPASAFKYIDTLGGTSFRSQTVDFTSTWYYFYGLEVEAVNMKKAPIFADNLIDINPKKWELGTLNTPGTPAPSTTVIRYKEFIPVEPNTVYTMSRDVNAPVFLGIHEMPIEQYGTRVLYTPAVLTNSTTSITFTTTGTTKFLLITANTNDLDYLVSTKLQIERGLKATPYKPYSLGLKSASLVPKNNLLNPDLSNWEQGSAGGQWELFGDNTRVRIAKRVQIKPNTQYTLKVKGNYDIYVRQFAYEGGYESGASQWNADGAVITSTTVARLAGIIIRKKDNSAIKVSDISEAMPMMVEGAVTEYKPYELVMKPAILYPKKNMLDPNAWQAGRLHDNAFKPTSFRVEPNRVVLVSSFNSMVSQYVDVLPNTDYSVYHDSPADGRRGIYIYSLTGTDLKPTTHVSPVTFNTGANTRISVAMYKSASANDMPEIDVNYPMMEKGTPTSYEAYQAVMKPN